MEAFVERMSSEYDELNERVNKLSVFLGTDKYKSLNLEEQDDLITQYHSMVIYKIALRKRLKRQGIDKTQDTEG